MSLNFDTLEQHLTTRSYIEGELYTPSQADIYVYNLLTAPESSKYPYSARWYSHIKSYSVEHAALAGTSTAGQAFIQSASAPAPAAADAEEEVDLFASDNEDNEETERLKADRVAAYNAKKANKIKAAAKSVVTLEVKPWDDETDMEALEQSVRSIEQEGLVWGASKLVAVGYGIKKLQITLVVEDELVSLGDLQEKLAEFNELFSLELITRLRHLRWRHTTLAPTTIHQIAPSPIHFPTVVTSQHPYLSSFEQLALSLDLLSHFPNLHGHIRLAFPGKFFYVYMCVYY
ncbi:hypothetical protein DFH29DRAFT_799217 [Suillus ampliporus]|nr:hypothetical protein DFH29DRAFT_799217 [Suillus ampliporus]